MEGWMMTDDDYQAQSAAIDSLQMTRPDRPGLTVGVILYTAAAGLAIYGAVMGLAWVFLNNA